MTGSAVLSSFLALGAMFVAANPALAEDVTYTTTGSFSQLGTNVFEGTGGAKLTFNAITAPVDDALPTQDTLGNFSVSLPKNSSIPGTGTFLLTINQSTPNGTADFGAAGLSGLFSTTGPTGSLTLTFGKTSVTIDQITYTLQGLGGADSNQLVIGKSGQDVEAVITTALPEPTFLALTAFGFFGLVGVAAVRKRQA